MNRVLPTFQAFISSEKDNQLVVDCVAFVDTPAIKKNFIAFNEDKAPEERLKFSEVDTAQRIVVGPAMIPDLLIYRNNPVIGEHQVFFSKETVGTIAERFFAEGFNHNANEMHDPKMKIDGMAFFMSFIRDADKGLIGLAGDYPDGTWFLGAKVTNDDLWAKVLDGTYKGFSVEGAFQYKESQEEQAFNEIGELLKEDTEEALKKIIELLNIYGTN